MKTMLVPVEEHHGIASVLETAALAAARFGSRVEGMPLGPDFQVAMDYGIAVTINNHDFRKELEAQAQRIFEDFATRRKGSEAGVSYVWRGNGLSTDLQLGAHGRIFDLIVVGRPGADVHDARHATFEAALFDSGRPVLIAPPEGPVIIGETVALSWNGSSETARTIAMGMPFLQSARRIVVIGVSGAMVQGPTSEQLTAMLRAQGLPVELKLVDDTSTATGRTILRVAGEVGADLLLKGGYTQSRLRQMIFGGATSQILAEATIPVLMAH